MTTGVLWEIVDGVRRARAFQLAGAQVIRALPQEPDGSIGLEFVVNIDDLRSPHKTAIDMSTNAQRDRFFRISNAIQRGEGFKLPPILVQQGSRGCKVEEIGWTY